MAKFSDYERNPTSKQPKHCFGVDVTWEPNFWHGETCSSREELKRVYADLRVRFGSKPGVLVEPYELAGPSFKRRSLIDQQPVGSTEGKRRLAEMLGRLTHGQVIDDAEVSA